MGLRWFVGDTPASPGEARLDTVRNRDQVALRLEDALDRGEIVVAAMSDEDVRKLPFSLTEHLVAAAGATMSSIVPRHSAQRIIVQRRLARFDRSP